MGLRRVIGIILIAFGVFALAVGGFSYTTNRTVIDAGPVQATAREHHRVPLSPLVGIVAVGAGVVLLVVGRREPT